MSQIHTLGFPRVGLHRELKFAVEKYWRGELSATELENVGRVLRARHWELQRAAGLDFVSVGDFAFYDHILNHIQLLGCEPARFEFAPEQNELSRYFIMARGLANEHEQQCGTACNHTAGSPALEMTKWFDTNYHYLVPEFTETTTFNLNSQRLFEEVQQAQDLGHPVKVVLVGALSFLWLGKEKTSDFERHSLLVKLLPVYQNILQRLHEMGVTWVQIDEPILGLDLSEEWKTSFQEVYTQLATLPVKILLASYFSPLEENLNLACGLPVAGLHIDAVRAKLELTQVAACLPEDKILSVGIIDGRNIWRSDLTATLEILRPIAAQRGENLWIAPSCSLLHVPISLETETLLDAELKSWLAFAGEKLVELNILKQALNGKTGLIAEALADNQQAIASRRHSQRVSNPEVAQRLNDLPSEADRRNSVFPDRRAKQQARFQLPAFPTTTIGSFPQTAEIRGARAAFKRGELDSVTYQQQMHVEIAHAVEQQETLDLDVLVHGEAERNDMVEYFGEQLAGFAFTKNGWVQSYGSRCVKPPVIYGDVSRPVPMTVDWTVYAQSLTSKPMKGMLTGPITILQWSFVRDDQPRAKTALQIALAIRDEVVDLEKAGIGIIQIDEPAIREGLPLRKNRWKIYLAWATRAFRISASGVADDTQIHTHMCYSEFNDIGVTQLAQNWHRKGYESETM
jgi:5-methyltetrahydropteroyltriglutamate--homocysteine methyltransferase